ncbi:TonB-dependent receptor [Pseudoflavitalea sp. X16]|uniref:outer membrane beta-barrel family protein n=1 Tax=Paraflavitalea devenefica TaxID=2716334 RepID=UPI00142402A1|nr:outer membrane beta-barrel family protein [Paraflavitalea devenefica]NII26749.1 TonB-dependent receptor [Paraflavitalea devenefica]
MRTKLTLATIILTVLNLVALAQNGASRITGKVGDASQAAIQAATVTLLKAKDSAVVKMSVSDKAGQFEFENIPDGKYLLAVSAVGHTKKYTPAFEVAGTAVEVAPVVLAGQSKEMKAVTVTASRPMIEQKIDKTVLNVEASVTNVGANALEVLEKAPGVQVDKDGNISLKGKQGVIIMMDGRPSYLSGPELANLLKGMQASQLDQIEIMTNPPAKYDAAGNSGIINIKTKKNKIKGFNGNITAGVGQGVYFKTNESISLNYRDGKMNLFSSYSFGYNENFQQLDIYRRYKNDDKTTNAIFEQTAFMKRMNRNNNLKLGMDYYLTQKTTLGIVLSGSYNPQTNDGDNTSYLKNPMGQVDSIVKADSYIREAWKNGSVNLNIRHQFDSTGREFSADLDYIRYDASNDQYFINTTFSPVWVKRYDEQLNGVLPSTIDIYSAKADYTLPLKKGAKLEMGVKSSYVTTDNKANYSEFVGGQWQPDITKTNYFDYEENINAAYVSFNKQLNKKWGVQAGLRFENTNLKGRQTDLDPDQPDSSFDRSYNGLFPTIYFSYNASKDNQFGISYGRRIDRPGYQDLNPFMFFIDKYTYGRGNPFLKPQYSNNFEFTHIFKGILTTNLNYSITKDVFNETFTQEKRPNGERGYATIVREGNIGKRENAGIAVSVQTPVAKWLTIMVYTNYNYIKYSGVVNGEELKIEAGNLMMNMNNQFKFNKGWGAELSGWYRTKGPDGQILLDPFGQLSAGVSKQVLKGKGTVKLNVRDIFYTQQPKGHINFENTEARFKNSRDTRVVNLTLTYRFGKPLKNGNGQRKKGGAGEEQNRVKGAGE